MQPQSIYAAKLQKAQKRKGLCVWGKCPKKANDGVRCKAHAAHVREHNAAHFAARRARGECRQCGRVDVRTAAGRVLCAEHCA